MELTYIITNNIFKGAVMLYKTILNVVGVVAVVAVALTGCGDDNGGNPGGGPGVNPSVTTGTFADSRDGKTYKKVTIGGKTWMAENLNYAAEGSKCYEDNPSNCATYGRLYNWATALTACPSGWHLPTDAEWTALTNFVGSNAGTKLKSSTGWRSSSSVPAGTDQYGFSALPGGYGTSRGDFNDVGSIGYWWSDTDNSGNFARARRMIYFLEYVYGIDELKTKLFSVRCVQN
jgi:uncharacterized protein (TIGR02145 family)